MLYDHRWLSSAQKKYFFRQVKISCPNLIIFSWWQSCDRFNTTWLTPECRISEESVKTLQLAFIYIWLCGFHFWTNDYASHRCLQKELPLCKLVPVYMCVYIGTGITSNEIHCIGPIYTTWSFVNDPIYTALSNIHDSLKGWLAVVWKYALPYRKGTFLLLTTFLEENHNVLTSFHTYRYLLCFRYHT